MSRYPFHSYPNRVLVETGSYLGDGIQAALDAGFAKVISFEIVLDLYQHCKRRFAGDVRVKLVHGSSASLLYDTIKDISEPITFWLDGHYSYGRTGYDSQYICPLLQELEQIKKHGAYHTVLIDDRRLLKRIPVPGPSEFFDVDEDTVVTSLRAINPEYVIRYEYGYVPEDVIAARPPA
jgi:hypothetical protein